MASSTKLSREEWSQKAILLHQLSQKLINEADPQKCLAGFTILGQMFGELVANCPDDQQFEILTQNYTNLYLLAWRGCTEPTSLIPFADQVARPFADLTKVLIGSKPQSEFTLSPDKVGHLNLGYITTSTILFGRNAIARATLSLMIGHAALNKNSRKPFLYLLTKPDQAYLDALSQIDVEAVDISHIKSSAERSKALVAHAREHKVQALICDEGLAVPTMVYAQRAAPIQAFADMGFAVWGLDDLDICLAASTDDPKVLNHSSRIAVQTKRPAHPRFTHVEVDPAQVEALRDELLQNVSENLAGPDTQRSLIFGTYGRLVKIDEDYLKRAEAILEKAANSILFIGGTGNPSLINHFLASSPVSSRILFVPKFVNGFMISSVIDAFLDTHPFPGGFACEECQIKGVPVIWRGEFEGNNFSTAHNKFRDIELMARTDEDYVAKAVALTDKEIWKEASKRAHAVAMDRAECTEAAREIEEILSERLQSLHQSQLS